MKKNVLVRVGERTEIRERIVPAVYDENGEIVTEKTVKQYTVTIPIMEARNVDMTPDEIAEFERQQAELPEPEPTAEERMEAQVLYTALMTDTLLEVYLCLKS